MQTRHRKITRLLAPVAAFTLVAAACGDDDDDAVDEEDLVDVTVEIDDTTVDTSTEDTAEAVEDDPIEEGSDADTDEGPNIVELAMDTPELSTLVTAVDTAGLVETLSGEGPFTVFAPTNEAFDTALDDLGITLDEFLTDPDELTSVLTYHVIDGEVFSTEITQDLTAASLEGTDLTFGTDGGVTVNGVAVVTADVEASNGVVHIIDGVLFP